MSIFDLETGCGIIRWVRTSLEIGVIMPTVFSGHYDGHVIVPDQPLSLPIGEKLQLRVEDAPVQPGQLAEFAAGLPDSPGDLSSRCNDDETVASIRRGIDDADNSRVQGLDAVDVIIRSKLGFPRPC
jgi:hypothetical protein